MMSHSSANVRKGLVLLMVEVSESLADDRPLFETYLRQFSSNHQRLISIYIERRQSALDSSFSSNI